MDILGERYFSTVNNIFQFSLKFWIAFLPSMGYKIDKKKQIFYNKKIMYSIEGVYNQSNE